MTMKKVQPRRGRGKADAQRAANELTADIAQGGAKGSGEVNHALIAWALAGVLAYAPESRDARHIIEAADGLGGATSKPETFDLRAERMLRALLDAHTSCAYDLDGQDRAKGRRAYARLVALAGGAEGSPEPKDKDSCAWWCWTMRRIRAGFYGDPDTPEGWQGYDKSWREVDSLAFGIFGGASAQRTGVQYALSCLPALVKAKQWDEHWKRKGQAKGGAR